MAKFCTKCGKPLEEGGECSCQKSQPESTGVSQAVELHTNSENGEQTISQTTSEDTGSKPPTEEKRLISEEEYQKYQQQLNDAKEKSTVYIQALIAQFLNILKKPATNGPQFVKSGNLPIALGLILFQGLMSALFGVVLFSKVNSIISKLESLVGGYGVSSSLSSYKIPLVKDFFLTLIISFALSCILAGILFGINYLFKNIVPYKTMLCLVANRSVALIPITVIAIVLSFLNVNASIFLFFLGNILGLCYLFVSFPITTQENRDKVPLIIFISVVIFAFLSIFVMYHSIPVYLPDSIKDAWDTIVHEVNPSNFINSMLEDSFY